MNPVRTFAAVRYRSRATVWRVVFAWLGIGVGLCPPSAQAYELEGYSWPKNQPIVLDLQLGSPGYTLIDGSTSWDQVAKAAIDIWNPYLGGGVSLQAGSSTATPALKDGRNSVLFSGTVFGKSFGSDTLAVTTTYYNPRTNLTTEADVVFNSAKVFDSYRGNLRRSSGGSGLADFRRIALHEFGHVLGLDHVDQGVGSIMTPYTTNLDTLQEDDINGVYAVYGTPVRTTPVITSSLAAEAGFNHNFTYQIAASNYPTSFQAAGLPAGFYVNSSTGVISGSARAGTYNITISATNSAGTGSASLMLTVNGPPVISGDMDYTIRLNEPFSYEPTVSGNATSFVATGALPAGLVFDKATGSITGTPVEAGTFRVYVYGVNAYGAGAGVYVDLKSTLLDPGLVTIRNFTYSPDGGTPQGPLLEASDGNFYGLTSNGGSNGDGTAFRLTRDGNYTVIYNFAWPDGYNPHGKLTEGRDGALYGVTGYVVFRLTPEGVQNVVHRFNPYVPNPSSLLLASDGNLYGGTASEIYRITPDGAYSVVHTLDGPTEGYSPSSLLQAADGNFYGTTSGVGSAATVGDTLYGTAFKLTPEGVFTTLHKFGGADGRNPSGALALAADGSFYGTATSGGANNYGTVFKVTPAGEFTSLHSFTYLEGSHPSPLILATDGNFYGAAASGGMTLLYSNGGDGTLFKLAPDGTLTPFHLFDGTSGYAPSAPLMLASDGNLYGTTANGGTGFGSIFKRPLLETFVGETAPTVGLVVTTPEVTAGAGGLAQFTVTLSAPQKSDLIVNYTIKGSAINGTDYVELKGTKKIKAGKTSKPIKIYPLGNLGGVSKKTVKLTLAPGDGYTVETTAAMKVKILAAP